MRHGRVMADVMNLLYCNFLVCFALFFSLGAPSLASQGLNTSTGAFRTPTRTCDQPALPGSEAIKSKRDGAVRTTVTLHLGRTALGVSFLAGRVPGSPVAPAMAHLSVAGNLKTNQDAPVTVHWLHSSSRDPNPATVAHGCLR
jgi:hypothetical protein